MANTRGKPHKHQRSTRRSVALSKELDTRIKVLARQQNRSANQIIENLIAAGLEAKEAEKRRFFEVAERMRTATDPAIVKQAKEELAHMIFGN
jgi:predicted transcriptional regulator